MKNEIPIVRERIQTVRIIHIYDFMMQKSQHQWYTFHPNKERKTYPTSRSPSVTLLTNGYP